MVVPARSRSGGSGTGCRSDPHRAVVVPRALTPVHCDVEHGVAVYVEPNVWVVHPTGPMVPEGQERLDRRGAQRPDRPLRPRPRRRGAQTSSRSTSTCRATPWSPSPASRRVVGQVLARVRHALRRGAAALLRVGSSRRMPPPAPAGRRAARAGGHRPCRPRWPSSSARGPTARAHAPPWHADHPVEPAADALLARRALPRGHAASRAEAFSPNTAAGACPECHGLGEAHDVAEDMLVPDPSLTVREGAIAAWPAPRAGQEPVP